jgi:hypothetical protein
MSSEFVGGQRGALSKSSIAVVKNPFVVATYCFSVLGVAIAGITVNVEPIAVAAIGALLCGWSEVDGLCGTSHVGALTPLSKVAHARGIWFKAVLAYTFGGVVTAAVIGGAVGFVGESVATTGMRPFVLQAVALLAALLTARELRLLNFPLPQVDRQTERTWAMQFGFVTAAAMWGSHIGLGVATVITHGGLFIVAALALALGPTLGSVLFVAFWLGRTLPIWIAPLIADRYTGNSFAEWLLASDTPAYRYVASTGMVCAGLAALILGW